jgi:hypothetical protein
VLSTQNTEYVYRAKAQQVHAPPPKLESEQSCVLWPVCVQATEGDPAAPFDARFAMLCADYVPVQLSINMGCFLQVQQLSQQPQSTSRFGTVYYVILSCCRTQPCKCCAATCHAPFHQHGVLTAVRLEKRTPHLISIDLGLCLNCHPATGHLHYAACPLTSASP